MTDHTINHRLFPPLTAVAFDSNFFVSNVNPRQMANPNPNRLFKRGLASSVQEKGSLLAPSRPPAANERRWRWPIGRRYGGA
jgi:hypothetical protein